MALEPLEHLALAAVMTASQASIAWKQHGALPPPTESVWPVSLCSSLHEQGGAGRALGLEQIVLAGTEEQR